MLSASTILYYCLLTLLSYKTINLIRYVWLAKKTGLRYTITPFLETEVIAFLLTPILRHIYHDHLNKGTGWPRWCRFIIKDWSWEDKRIAHDEFGDVFLCVSPEGIICYSADAEMGWNVMNRRNEFTKPPDKYSEFLNRLPFFRRLIGPCRAARTLRTECSYRRGSDVSVSRSHYRTTFWRYERGQ